tara:strand:- start:223 stop:426 length:204 start_codon:yes stop_codon:yes gene_type:complete
LIQHGSSSWINDAEIRRDLERSEVRVSSCRTALAPLKASKQKPGFVSGLYTGRLGLVVRVNQALNAG